MDHPVLPGTLTATGTDWQRPELVGLHYPSPSHRVEIISGDCALVSAAIEIEVESLSQLGDKPYEIREEFRELNPHSQFLMVFRKSDPAIAANIRGVLRLVPPLLDRPNKTLADLSDLRSMDLLDVERMFREQSGCDDMSHLWDLATLAFPAGHGRSQRAMAGAMLIRSVASFMLHQHEIGAASHVTSFNQVEFFPFAEGMGFPFVAFMDETGEPMKPMIYETFEPGVGMVAVPHWLAMTSVHQVVNARATTHASAIADGSPILFRPTSAARPML